VVGRPAPEEIPSVALATPQPLWEVQEAGGGYAPPRQLLLVAPAGEQEASLWRSSPTQEGAEAEASLEEAAAAAAAWAILLVAVAAPRMSTLAMGPLLEQ
jgi:hypothetical protein